MYEHVWLTTYQKKKKSHGSGYGGVCGGVDKGHGQDVKGRRGGNAGIV